MNESIHNISMMILTLKNYQFWIKEIQKLAIQHKVWLYIDSNEDIEKSKLKISRISDYQMKVEDITRPTQSASELSDAQRKAYKYDVLDYQVLNQQSEKIKREIKAVDDAVKLSARQHIHQMISSIRQIIQTLTTRYKQDDASIEKSTSPIKSFANTVIRNIKPLIKSVIYDSRCSDPLTYDKDRFLREIKLASDWIKTLNDQMKMEEYGTMQMLEKSENKIIKMEFANTAYVLITSMTLVSSTKLIKEGYDRDMHTKTLVHVATEKKVCDIEEHFGVMTLEFNPIQPTEYVEYGATVDPRNEMENAASINPRSSTATVEMTAPNEVLNNQAPNKKIEVLIDQASTKEKEVEKTSQPTTNSEQISHGKSDTESHIMKLNQSDEGQQNSSLNNPHPSRQVDSGGGGDQFTKAPNSNGGPKARFTKALNGGLNKHKKPPITNQKEVENSHRKIHHKDSNRIEKAW